MTSPLDGVRSATSVRAESSETTLTVVMGDDSPLPKKRPVTAPPSSSSPRQYSHIEIESTEKHRPDCARGSHKPHQGECRHPEAAVTARASLIAKDRLKVDYGEDAGDDASRTTQQPEQEASKSGLGETPAGKTDASGSPAAPPPANKFTLSDSHVLIRASRKGTRLNDPDEFHKAAAAAQREEVDATPLLPVRRTSSMAKYLRGPPTRPATSPALTTRRPSLSRLNTKGTSNNETKLSTDVPVITILHSRTSKSTDTTNSESARSAQERLGKRTGKRVSPSRAQSKGTRSKSRSDTKKFGAQSSKSKLSTSPKINFIWANDPRNAYDNVRNTEETARAGPDSRPETAGVGSPSRSGTARTRPCTIAGTTRRCTPCRVRPCSAQQTLHPPKQSPNIVLLLDTEDIFKYFPLT